MAIRILHVVTYMGRGGLETMLMNYYRHIDRRKVQFDFLVHRDFEAEYDSEIKALGGRIYRLPKLNPFSPKYLSALNNFFKEHKGYSIVHSHLDCMSAIPLKYALKHGIKTRIAHAHANNQTKDKKYLLKLIFKKFIPRYASHLFACTDSAGSWMFNGKEFTVLKNAIDTEKYVFSSSKQQKIRNEFNIPKDAFVLGHVGRFDPPKNHSFILSVFSSLIKKLPNSYLLLVGKGALEEDIKKTATSLKIAQRVIFAGSRDDVALILSAMDAFIFPSLYEGLGIAVIEAQAAALPCIISEGVPSECDLTGLVKQLNLSDGEEIWSSAVIPKSGYSRGDMSAVIKAAGFDIRSNTEILQKFYLESEMRNG